MESDQTKPPFSLINCLTHIFTGDYVPPYLLKSTQDEIRPEKPEQIWRSADWYSIICSLMLRYEHIYADISFILHSDTEILPLLKQTLKHERLKTRILYGIDFYVVRNHKSDKNMLTNIMGDLTKEEYEQIESSNPITYLKQKK